jgi:hypothetical protein
MADIDSKIRLAEEEDQKRQKAQADRAAAQQADDRSLIARVVVFSFVGLVVLVVLAAMAGTYYLGWDKLVEPGKYLVGLLGSIMLPVVTLVIGYYFGSK